MKNLLTFISLLALLPGQALAGTLYVLNNADSGSGSLRQEITDSNSAGGANTISWITGSGGTINMQSGLPSINANTTLDVTAATNAVTLSGSGYSVGLGGAVTFSNGNLSNDFVVDTTLTGVGSLTKTGDGVLWLLGNNTYAGGTAFNGGVVTVYSDSALGATSGGLSFNGGTLRLANNVTSSRSILLNSGGGVFDTGVYELVLSGLISGTGSLTKNGSGTLVLNSAGSYTGGTIISSGTLQMGVNNALGSSGSLTVSSAGTFNMKSYTQSLSSYVNSGVLRLLLASGVTNLSVSGTAMLGGTLDVLVSPQLYTDGQTFTPIMAGTLSGQFSTIVSPAALHFVPTYTSTSVILTVDLVPFSDLAATQNQRTIGNALEPLRVSPTGDVATVISNLYTLSSSKLRETFDQLGPLALSSMHGMSRAASDLQSSSLSRRFDMLAAGGGASYSSYSAGGQTSGGVAVSSSSAVKNDSPFGSFISAAGSGGKSKEAADSAGYSFYNAGALAGGDWQMGEHLSLGVMGGYLHGRADISYPGTGKTDSNSLRYGVYAAAYGGGFQLDLYAGMARDSFTTKRNISFGDIYRTASAKPKGNEVNLYGRAGYDFENGSGGTLSPQLSMNYDRLTVDPFTESGADSLNLSVSRQTAESLRSNLGMRYSDRRSMGNYLLASYISLGWGHEFKSNPSTEARLASAGSDLFSITTANYGKDGLLAGIGTSVNWGTAATVSVDYSADLRARLTEQILHAALHWNF